MRRLLRLFSSFALVVSLGGCYWFSPGAGTDRRSHNPVENGFSPGTVGDFVAVWSADTDETTARGLGNPVTSTHGYVHVTSSHTKYAFNFETGAQVWSHTSPARVLNTDLYVFDRGSNSDLIVSSYAGADPRFQLGIQWSAPNGHFLESESTGRLDASRSDRVEAILSEFRASPTTPGAFIQNFVTFGSVFNRVDVTDQPDFDNRLTLGDGKVFHSGIGVGTTPANGVRVWPLNGGPTPTWATPIDGARSTSPVLSEDQSTVYVGTDAGTLYALDAASGAVLWSSAVGSAVTDSPALADGTLFVPTASGSLVALDAAGCESPTCSPDWTTPAGASLTVQPAVGGGVVFVGAADGSVQAFAAAGCGGPACTPLWSDDTGSAITGAPAVSLGKVFVGTQDGRLIAYGLPT